MAGQILLVGAALAAAYAASKPKMAEADAKSNDTDRSQIGGKVDAAAAAAAPGVYTANDGSVAESDCGGLNQDKISNGTTSNTPSGDTLGGSTSNTPSSGPTAMPIVGAVMTPDATSSPSGPTPHPTMDAVKLTSVSYGNTSGLTVKQMSRQMAMDGPVQGLVW